MRTYIAYFLIGFAAAGSAVFVAHMNERILRHPLRALAVASVLLGLL